MAWLKDNVYVAAWLALPVMVIIAIIQRGFGNPIEGKREAFPLKKILSYLLFLICFPLVLTPWVEIGVRIFCGFASFFLFILILQASDKDWSE